MQIIYDKEQIIEIAEKLPPYFYKYRNWDNPNHKTIITRRQLFFANPDTFDDPYDCKNPTKFINLKYEDKVRVATRHKKQYSLKIRIDDIARQLNVKYPNSEEREHQINCNLHGILCLCYNKNSDDMWQNYASNHSGFLVAFKTKELFLHFYKNNILGGIVQYANQLPYIYPEPINTLVDQFKKLYYHKLDNYEFEEEYRFMLSTERMPNEAPLSDNERIVEIPAEAYGKIIIGKNMPEENEIDLKNSIPEELSSIQIFRNC